MRPPHRVASLLLPAVLASCASSPPLPPASELPAAGALATLPDTNAEPPADQWWRQYRQPALDALVEQAVRDNRNIRAAAARLLKAQALAQESADQRHPSATLSADAGRGSTLQDQIAAAGANSDQVRTGPRYGLGAGLAWELDLFGRLHASITASQADVQASAAVRDGVRIATEAAVTDAWLRSCGLGRQLALARQALALQQRQSDLAGTLLAAGATTPTSALQANAELANLQALLPPLQAMRERTLAELAALTGQPPTSPPAAAVACTRLPALARVVPVGDGQALLRRRPDVRAAERRLAASTARIGVAVADLYPRIALGGELAASSPDIDGLGARINRTWRLGPLISWSFPNLGSARARVRQARAGQDIALAEFDATVLEALKEASQAASSYQAAWQRQDALAAAAGRSRQLATIATAQLAAGAIPPGQALLAQEQDLQAQSVLARAQAEVAATQVALFKALGGGWQAPAMPSPSPSRSPAP